MGRRPDEWVGGSRWVEEGRMHGHRSGSESTEAGRVLQGPSQAFFIASFCFSYKRPTVSPCILLIQNNR